MKIQRTSRMLAGAVLVAFLATGCTNASQTGGGAQSGNASGAASSSASVAGLSVNEEARALLPQAVKDKGSLIVASDPSYPPFEVYDTDNKTIIGWDIDMGDAVGQVLGLKIEHVPATFDTILPGLSSGKYDMGMSAFSVSAERRKAVDFVPYNQGGSAVAVKPGNPEKLAMNADALCGKSIAAQKGTSQSQDILPLFTKECTDGGKPAIDIQLFPSQNDANLALISGRVQGVMADSVSLAYQGKLADGKFEVAAGPDYESQLTGVALKKNSEMLKAVQKAMQVVIESPTYKEVNAKWNMPASTEITSADVILK